MLLITTTPGSASRSITGRRQSQLSGPYLLPLSHKHSPSAPTPGIVRPPHQRQAGQITTIDPLAPVGSGGISSQQGPSFFASLAISHFLRIPIPTMPAPFLPKASQKSRFSPFRIYSDTQIIPNIQNTSVKGPRDTGKQKRR